MSDACTAHRAFVTTFVLRTFGFRPSIDSMSSAAEENLYPTHQQLVSRAAKETQLGQRGMVIWLYGLSGSGKTTLAATLEHELHTAGRHTIVLDGDNIRTGLNRGLGFSDADREENIRRVAEVAKLFAQNGTLTFCSFITPNERLRALARDIIGKPDLLEVYVSCSFEECQRRDVKGLYRKVAAGQVAHFTGKDSGFETPAHPDLVLDTEHKPLEESLALLRAAVDARIRLTKPSDI